MAVDLVWHFSSRQRAQDFLWALLSVGRASGWRHLLVVVDRREKVEVAMQFDELITEGRVEWVTRLLENNRLRGLTLEDLVEDPWQWRELYLDGGVKAFRWWQGAGPGERRATKGMDAGVSLPGRHIGPGEGDGPPGGATRGDPPARRPGPGPASKRNRAGVALAVLVRGDRTIYGPVKKRRKRRGR